MSITNQKRLVSAPLHRGGGPFVLTMIAMIAVSCGGGAGTETRTTTTTQPPVVTQPPTTAPQTNRGVTQQEAFLARIKNAASGNNVIRDARMNGDNELGVVLSENVKLRQVRPLMQTLLKEMRDEFPNRVLTVRAYAPNGQELAVMRHDPSAPRGRDTTFTPAPGFN
ncbi:MAG: hypothetical protein H0T92_19800 [Pyrinomonadaceae bacterium]|nr:hypothetical protein [Pyrinomonadaceae bacterium]